MSVLPPPTSCRLPNTGQSPPGGIPHGTESADVWSRRRLLLLGIPAISGILRLPAVAQDPPREAVSSCASLQNWNRQLLAAIRSQTPPPCLVARILALAHLSMWQRRSETKVSSEVPDSADQSVFRALFPSLAMPGSLPAASEDRLEAVRNLMESRADDGSSTTVHYVPLEGPGQWRRTPPAFRPPETPHWGKVRPFLLQSPDQFRPSPPPTPASPAFQADLDEVRRLGAMQNSGRKPDETESARFWSDFSYTSSPPGHWNEIACQLAVSRRLDLGQGLRLMALLNVALADAAIACWDCKYHYNYWRPVTALNQDPAARWEPLLATPPHPDYVSGHSVFSGAAVAVLRSVFGSDRLPFSATSDTVRDKVRHYRSLGDCAEEISRSRVFGGIHFPAACREGLALGDKIGTWAVRHFRE